MVFADAKDVQPHLIGVFDLLDEVSQTVLRAHGTAAVVERGGEAVNPNLHQQARLRGSPTVDLHNPIALPRLNSVTVPGLPSGKANAM